MNEGDPQVWSTDFGRPLFYACSNQVTGSVPVYRGVHPGGFIKGGLSSLHMSGTDLNDFAPNGFTMDWSGRPNFYAFPQSSAGMTGIHRLFSPETNDHMLSTQKDEGGYTYDGRTFYAYPSA